LTGTYTPQIEESVQKTFITLQEAVMQLSFALILAEMGWLS
jgi:hypothetical protein